MDELKKIIDELALIRAECDDDLLFSKAIDIYLAKCQVKNRDVRTERDSKDDNLATDKQLFILKKNKFKLDYANLTKQEASKIISEMFERNKGAKEENFDADAY